MDTESQSQSPAIRLLIVTLYRLEGEMMAAQFACHEGFSVESMTSEIPNAAAVCRERRPDVVLLGAAHANYRDTPDISALIQQFFGTPVLLLDDDTNYGRLAAVLESSAVGYFTRAASFAELVDGVRKMAHGMRAFCSRVQSRIERTSAGWHLRAEPPVSALGSLTRRELEIARLVATGSSIRDCASALHLSPKTIDNHKSRLMKKLGLHKAQDLTRLAIREGLIPF
jgi:two-component system, NarL family, response regulator NreC